MTRAVERLRCFGAILAFATCAGALAQFNIDAAYERANAERLEPPRMVLAFYYIWYGNPAVAGGSGQWCHWNGVDEAIRQIASSTHYPLLGPYDSCDAKLIARHCAWARQAGVDGLIASWWGKGSFSDRAMPPLLQTCADSGMSVTLYYETVPPPKTPDSATIDLLDVLRRYAQHPAWLKVGGKPVVFVYGRALNELGLSGWLEVVTAVSREYAPGVVFIGDQLSRSSAMIFDGIHTYNTAGALAGKDVSQVRQWAESAYPSWVRLADEAGRISTVTVIPGYDDAKIRKPGLRVGRFDGQSYEAQWQEAIKADPRWVLITSWNEWHEGSEIEPSVEYSEKYLSLTREFARRFKAQPARARSEPAPPIISDPERRALRDRLCATTIALLPGADSHAVWWLLRLGVKPVPLTWEQVADGTLRADTHPLLLYAGGEHYRQTARTSGDVDDAIRQYLHGGGTLVAIPSEPVPLYYNERGQPVNTALKIGLPLGIGPAEGGWERPPAGERFEFVRSGTPLPHTDKPIPFPTSGDVRWRPFRTDWLAPGDDCVPLLELRNVKGESRGLAACSVRYGAGDLKGGRVIYVWFGLMNVPQADAVLYDVFAIAAHAEGG